MSTNCAGFHPPVFLSTVYILGLLVPDISFIKYNLLFSLKKTGDSVLIFPTKPGIWGEVQTPLTSSIKYILTWSDVKRYLTKYISLPSSEKTGAPNHVHELSESKNEEPNLSEIEPGGVCPKYGRQSCAIIDLVIINIKTK